MTKTAMAIAPGRDVLIRGAIIDCAHKLMQHYGLNKTTMEDIAKALGKSKSSLYYYFSNKEEVFEAVIEQEQAHVFRQISLAVNRAITAGAKLKAFTYAKSEEMSKRPLFSKVIFDEVRDNIALIKLIRERFYRCDLEVINAILKEGIEQREFDVQPKNLAVTAKVCAITLNGLQPGLILEVAHDHCTTQHLLDITMDMLLRSLKK